MWEVLRGEPVCGWVVGFESLSVNVCMQWVQWARRGLTTPTTDPPTAAECNTEAEATAGMGTAARMTQIDKLQGFCTCHRRYVRSDPR